MPIIDVQAHYYPNKYLDLLEQFGKESGGELRAHRTEDISSDLDARIATMDRAGVDMQVLSPAGRLPHLERRSDAVDAARLANDLFAEFINHRPERLRAFAVVPLPHVDESLVELERALDELGMVGVTIGTSILGRSIADPSFEAFYEEMNRREAVLYVHPSGVGADSPLVSSHGLTWLIGAPIEDTIAAVHLILKGVTSRFPNIKIINSHMGGALPLLLYRLDALQAARLPDSPVSPSSAARSMWFDTVAHGDVGALRCAIDAFGFDRLVFGSDYPYQRDEWYTRAVTFVRDVGIDQRQVEAILSGNAGRLFGSKLPTSYSNPSVRPSRGRDWP